MVDGGKVYYRSYVANFSDAGYLRLEGILVADYRVIPRITARTLLVLGFDSRYGQTHGKAVTNLRRVRHHLIECQSAAACPMTTNRVSIGRARSPPSEKIRRHHS